MAEAGGLGVAAAGELARASATPEWSRLTALRRQRNLVVGGALIFTIVFVALFAPLVAPYGEQETDYEARLVAPSLAHPFGTDNLGRDILSRVIYGTRIDLRVGLIGHPERAQASIARAEAIQDEIWAHATALGHAQLQNPPIVALFIGAVNTMFDLQTKRVTITMHHRIPMPIWWSLMGITVFAMLLVGYVFGLAKRLPWVPLLIFSSAFSIVLVLIADRSFTSQCLSGLSTGLRGW